MSTSKSSSSLILFLVLNLVFFSLVSSCNTCPKPQSSPPPPPKPKTVPCPPPPAPHKGTCPTLKLEVCGNLLQGLIGIIIGTPDPAPCCTLISGLVDLDAAVCLCTAIKANVLGIVVDIPLSLNLLLNACGKKSPPGFKCG